MEEEANVVFNPPLWQQRLDKVMELVVKLKARQVKDI